MADGYVRSRSLSNSSLNDTYHSSPSNYVQTRVNYDDEGMGRAFKDVSKLALPITVTSLFISALLFCNLVWIGHHATANEYAGAALGNMLVNVMGNSIIIGMTSGLDTQCGQAFGAGVYKMLGVFMQRSLLISQFVVILIAVLFWQGTKILLLLGQEKNASEYAGTFCRIFCLSLWPIAMFANLRRFLQAQRKVVFIPVAVFMGLCTQIIALIILVNVMGFGYVGACAALPTSYWAMFLTLFTFTKCKSLHSDCWPGFGKWAFKDWFAFLKLTIPGTMMLCAEWWAFEVLALVAGTMSKGHKDDPDHINSATYVAAFTTCLNVLGIFIRIPLGISFANAVLVSNKLGAKLGNSARMVFNAAIYLSVSLCFLCGLFIFFCPGIMARLYTHDKNIVKVTEETLPYMAVYFVIDSFQRCCAGGTRGMGRQAWGAGIYIVSYYFVGMPLGIWFALKGFLGNGNPMYLKGLWVGAGISVTVCSFFFICLRLCVNWDREVERAQLRLEKEQRAIQKFKEHLKDGMDDETMRKILREPQPSLNEGHYIKYSDGGHQNVRMTEESVSGKTYDNVDNVDYDYDDMTFGADENDATLNDYTLDSNLLRNGSIGNSLKATDYTNDGTSAAAGGGGGGMPPGPSVGPVGSLPSHMGYAAMGADSNDLSSKRIVNKALSPNGTYNNNINNNFDVNNINNINNNQMNGNIALDVDENDEDLENFDENENENENENEMDDGMNVTMNGNSNENNYRNGGKKGLQKKALKKKKKRKKNKNKNTDSLGHQRRMD